ncbi:MAG: glycosyltransferase family 2 protein [Chloroflexia bacterium]
MSEAGETGLSVVIPAYNEERAIGAVLGRVQAVAPVLGAIGLQPVEVIVVDDGSADRTAEVVAECPGVTLIRHPRNRGYGAALKTGFRHARGGLLAFLDADGTYPPEALPALCRPILSGEADLAIGSRMGNPHSRMPTLRRGGNLLFAALLSVLGNHRVRDSASGMRVLRREILPLLYPLPDGLNFTPAMSARALHEGVRMVEVPIPYDERVGQSKLHPWRDGKRFLGSIVETVLAYNPVRPLGLLGGTGILVAMLYFFGLLGARLRGITDLGPWGTFGVFAALVSGVTGVSLCMLGATFNFLVALFHRRPVRQGVLGRPFLPPRIDRHFGWLGGGAIAAGVGLAAVCMALAVHGWPLLRLWLYLVGSAGIILIGVQLLVSWLLIRVLEALSRRVEEAQADLTGGRE